MFRPKPSNRAVFALEDDDEIGRLIDADADDTFDDIFSGRDVANQHAGTFVGNVLRPGRLGMGTVLLGITLGLFLGRVGLWQIVNGAQFRALADENRTRTVVLPSDRGVITDRNGVMLAWNEPSFRLIATVRDIPPGAAGDRALAATADSFPILAFNCWF